MNTVKLYVGSLPIVSGRLKDFWKRIICVSSGQAVKNIRDFFKIFVLEKNEELFNENKSKSFKF